MCEVCWSTTVAAVRFSTRTFDWNCCLASIIWHPAGSRPWQFSCTGPPPAGFDMVDHEILLQRLRVTFGIHDTVHRWFWSYLPGRTQYVRRELVKSSLARLTCGVPQGSVLDALLFIVHTTDLWCHWSLTTVSHHICTLTKRRCKVLANPSKSTQSRRSCLSAPCRL